MKQPFFSFVIPIYNCADFLPLMLDSIIYESDKNKFTYEVLIIDGNSSDNISQVIEKYKYKNLTYIHLNEKKSIDFDLNIGLKRAKGEYIWTLSGDDALVKNSLTSILNLLSKNPSTGVFINNSIHCSLNMKPFNCYGPYIQFFNQQERLIKITNSNDLIEYLNKTKTSESLFSFISSIIVKNSYIRPKLNQFESLNGSCWRYQSQLIDLILDYNIEVCLTNKFPILKRGDNDSFSKNGIPYRLLIATTMWVEVISQSKADFRIKKLLIKRAISDINLLNFLIAALSIKSFEDLNFFKKAFYSYSEVFYVNKYLKKVINLIANRRFKNFVVLSFCIENSKIAFKYFRRLVLKIKFSFFLLFKSIVM